MFWLSVGLYLFWIKEQWLLTRFLRVFTYWVLLGIYLKYLQDLTVISVIFYGLMLPFRVGPVTPASLLKLFVILVFYLHILHYMVLKQLKRDWFQATTRIKRSDLATDLNLFKLIFTVLTDGFILVGFNYLS